MYINHLPAETWNYLKMNGTEILTVPKLTNASFTVSRANNIECELGQHKGLNIDARDNQAMRLAAKNGVNVTGVGPDLDKLLCENNISLNQYEINENTGNTLLFSFKAVDKSNWASAFEITVKKGCKAKVIEEFESSEEAKAFLAVQTKFILEEGASLEFIQLQRLGAGVTFINDIGTMQAEKSVVNLQEVILKTAKTYLGSRANLVGDAAEFHAEVGYLVDNKDRLDMNFVAFQTGKKTDSTLNVKGILRDEAFKIFRGTIDFIKGCVASKGQELEDVLLLDDGVINQTIPLILCDEEDVEGDHGATIGQLDEEELFYLKSRGIKEEDIYEMLAKARLESVVAKISDEEIKTKWLSFIE
ncbi:SufB/SufD family protein [Lachnospira pectinoschiza]|uniref:Uncharacterized protein family (UPF0051) n=1 Tax=Lachnospira pectinoschiza TaxID=28052 RepID=A0A1G9WUW7_9FIRM|nr:SufD family Fe-S cluster assembly protein [Lachnospira pectinoschiza]SDM88247.1 Uncharacterized protein family (UPF0051) [Lachnospira pectinoschiza]